MFPSATWPPLRQLLFFHRCLDIDKTKETTGSFNKAFIYIQLTIFLQAVAGRCFSQWVASQDIPL
jgi:hypothetical protein